MAATTEARRCARASTICASPPRTVDRCRGAWFGSTEPGEIDDDHFDRIWRGPDYASAPAAPDRCEIEVRSKIPFETAAPLAIQASAAGASPAVRSSRTFSWKGRTLMAKMMTKSQIAGHLANKFELTK